MTRTEIINLIIHKNNYSSYLEIGVQNGFNFHAVKCKYKIGVDPDPKSKATIFLTSDDFFENNSVLFDVAFIDGLHHAEQVEKDILNALKFLSPKGTIICHDMNPASEAMQAVPRTEKVWTGNCWKAFVKLRTERNDLKMFVVDSDFGVGIIKRQSSKGRIKLKVAPEEITYANFSINKNNWLNLTSVSNFLKTV